MKAVVMEVKNKYAVVLKEDGTFEKIKRDCKVGETINITAKDKVGKIVDFKPKKIAKVAAAALVILAVSGSYYSVAMASDYMTVSEGDEEITVGLNRFGKVVSVNSDTPEGKEMVDALYEKGIKYDDVENAISKISVSFKDMNPEVELEALEVEIVPRNDRAYERISRQVIGAGAKIRDKDEAVKPADENPAVENKQEVKPGEVNPTTEKKQETKPVDGNPATENKQEAKPVDGNPATENNEEVKPVDGNTKSDQGNPKATSPDQTTPQEAAPKTNESQGTSPYGNGAEQNMPEENNQLPGNTGSGQPGQTNPTQANPQQTNPQQNNPGTTNLENTTPAQGNAPNNGSSPAGGGQPGPGGH